jgi:multiple sugar transport system substrate-binding protein
MKKGIVFLTIFVAMIAFTAWAEEMVELVVWDQLPQTEKVILSFNEKMEKEGRDVRARLELIPYEQQVPKFMAALNAGNAPDIYALDIVQYPYFISIGAFRDITEWYNKQPFKDELPKGLLEMGSKDEKIYALPYSIDLSAMLWNKDMFKEAGLDPENPPQTWYELLQASRKLTIDKDKDGIIDQWGFALVGGGAGAYMFWLMPFIWGNGGNLFDSYGNVILNSSNTKDALQLWHDLLYDFKVVPTASIQYGSGERYNLFASGKIGMFLGGNFNITTLLQDAPNMDFGVAPIPKNRGDFSSFGGGTLIGITSQCEHPELAEEFLSFAFQDEIMIETFAPNLLLLPRPSLYNNKYYDKTPQMKEFVEILNYAQTPKSIKYNELYDPIGYYFEAFLLNEMPAEEALEKCQKEIEKIVNQ